MRALINTNLGRTVAVGIAIAFGGAPLGAYATNSNNVVVTQVPNPYKGDLSELLITESGDIKVIGDAVFSGDVFDTGNITIEGDARFSGDVSNTNDIVVDGAVINKGDLTDIGNIHIDGAVHNKGDIAGTGEIKINGDLTTTGNQDTTGLFGAHDFSLGIAMGVVLTFVGFVASEIITKRKRKK